MIEQFYQQMAIPESCQLDQRVFKKLFYENTALNSADKKAFVEDIEDILWRYTLKPETINIPAFINQERDYSELAVIQVNLKNDARYQRIAQVIQKAIPYPVLLVFVHQQQLALSVADKVINQVDQEKVRLNTSYQTDWINLKSPNEAEQDFLNSCSIRQFSYQDYYAFYKDLTARIIALQCAKLGGRYQLDTEDSLEQRTDLLNDIHQAQQKIHALKNELKKETQFNRQVNLNMQIKHLEQTLEQHKQRVTGHG